MLTIDELILNDLELNFKFKDLNLTGNNLDFNKIYRDNKLDIIDLLHMDIQGSELSLIKDLIEYINNRKILNKISYYFIVFITLLPLFFFKINETLSVKWLTDASFLGLSFVTFNALSYLIDIKKGYPFG